MMGKPSNAAYLLAAGLVASIVTFGAAEAQAQDLQAIQAQIDALQATVKNLQKQVAEAKAEAAAARAVAIQRAPVVASAGASGSDKSDLDLKVKWKGAPEFTSADEKKFKFKVRGRLDTDYNKIDQDTPITFAPDVSATALRRARIGVEGVMFYDWKYILEVDFANDVTSVKDAYLQYTGLPVHLTVGHFKTYNSLEHMTSSNYITFMERAAFIEAFGIDRLIGAGASYAGNNWTLSAGVFGDTGAPNPFYSGFVGDENFTVAARGAWAPVDREVNGVAWGKGGGWGAWQIAGRYDVLDLSDSAFNAAGGCRNTSLGVNGLTGAVPASLAECGLQETWLVGVNWYLTDYVKLMFNYTESKLSEYPARTIPAVTRQSQPSRRARRSRASTAPRSGALACALTSTGKRWLSRPALPEPPPLKAAVLFVQPCPCGLLATLTACHRSVVRLTQGRHG
jgi:phosphate-selective porin